MGNRHSIDAIEFDALIGGSAPSPALTLKGMGEVEHDLGIETDGPESGAAYREVRHQISRDERFSFSTDVGVRRLIELLTVGGNRLQGACYQRDAGDNIPPGLKFYARKHDACGNDATASGSNHRRILSTKGHIYPMRLELPAARKASLTVGGILLSEDGTTKPSATVYNVALPSTFDVTSWCQLYQVLRVGNASQSVLLDPDSILGVTIDFGIAIEPKFGAARYATVVDVTKTAPIVTIRTDDAALLSSSKIPEAGLRCDHATTVIGVQSLDPSTGDPIAAATTDAHSRISVNGYAMLRRGFSASGSGVSTTEIVIETDTAGSGVTKPLVWTYEGEL